MISSIKRVVQVVTMPRVIAGARVVIAFLGVSVAVGTLQKEVKNLLETKR